MRNGFLGSLLALLTGTSLVLAQPAVPVPPEGVPPGGGSPAENFFAPEPSGPPVRIWGSAEYLLWVIKDSPLPVLVSSAPAPTTATLGRQGAIPLFGGSDVDNEARSGGRFLLGYWLNESQTIGIDGGYFFLGSRAIGFAASGTGTPGTPALGRPFFNLNTGAEDSQLVAFPGVLAGAVRVALSSRLQGAETNGIANVVSGTGGQVDLLVGFRYLELEEGLGITETLQVLPDVPVLGGS